MRMSFNHTFKCADSWDRLLNNHDGHAAGLATVPLWATSTNYFYFKPKLKDWIPNSTATDFQADLGLANNQSPPESGSPHATRDPSARVAANAKDVAQICLTFLSWCWTAEQSPP